MVSIQNFARLFLEERCRTCCNARGRNLIDRDVSFDYASCSASFTSTKYVYA